MALMTESAKVRDLRFEDRIAPFKDKIPEEVLKVIEEEQSKLSGLEQASSEFNVTRNYLDWLTSLPWGRHSEERLDIDHAKTVRSLPVKTLFTSSITEVSSVADTLLVKDLHVPNGMENQHHGCILAPGLANISTPKQAQQ